MDDRKESGLKSLLGLAKDILPCAALIIQGIYAFGARSGNSDALIKQAQEDKKVMQDLMKEESEQAGDINSLKESRTQQQKELDELRTWVMNQSRGPVK